MPAKSTTTTVTVLTPTGISPSVIRRWALRARRRLHLPGRIAVVSIPPALSRRLNTSYRRRRRPTNVLSFDYVHDGGGAGEIDGEVLLCPPVIRREAAKLRVPYRARFQFLLEHGLIHLLGLDHHTPTDQRRWERYEQLLV